MRFRITCCRDTRSAAIDRKTRHQLCADRDAAALRIGRDELQYIPDHVVQVQRPQLERPLAHEGPQPFDDLRGVTAFVLDVAECLVQFRTFGVPCAVLCEPHAGARVREDSREWLLDLVHDRCRQLAHQRQSSGVGQLQPRRSQLLFRVLELRDVATRIEHGRTLDRNALEMNEDGASLAGLRGDLAFDVADFSPGGEVGAIVQVISKQTGDPAHRLHFVRRVAEDHVDVRADEGEGAVLIGEEHGIRDAAERGAMQLL